MKTPTDEALEAVELFAQWDDYAADGCECSWPGRAAPCHSCTDKISPEEFDAANEFLRRQDQPDEYKFIGDARAVGYEPEPIQPFGSRTNPFRAPRNMLAGPMAVGILTGYR